MSKFFKFLSSLKLAVLNISVLAVLSAAGAFLESYFSAEEARALIYHSIWMQLALVSLAVNVLAVLVDRWPWKKHHLSFAAAHFGILMMIAGSWVTYIKGVDGSLRLEPGGETRSITLPSKILAVYSSFDGKNMSELYQDQPRFLVNRPSESRPYIIPLGSHQMEVVDFYPYALSSVKYKHHSKAGWAVQFLLKSRRARYSDWIYLRQTSPFIQTKAGPASIVLSGGSYLFKEKNELILEPQNKNTMYYKLRAKGKFQKAGEIKKGSSISTGWMDLSFQLLNFYRAERVYEFIKQESSSEQTVPALKVRYKNSEKWLQLNSFLSFYDQDRVFILGYMNQKKSIGADIRLKQFNITRYPNSMQAKEYESIVEIEGREEVISMNDPLTYRGWTFYQSGFEEDEFGNVQASILAVNKDPGRYIKYLGSVLIVIGIFALFYMRRKRRL